ncbi:X-linked interleukin-1 receptor accessory protein-like 2 isoform X2 [Halichoeres trimaculatus]|uniref:X-linked interleukin-1 receptor accessory protein-like 2 isoform X2 n=1 Tax=Halichoeres trimaculatus TaxID=147232 RepID=UPI003D9E8DCB
MKPQQSGLEVFGNLSFKLSPDVGLQVQVTCNFHFKTDANKSVCPGKSSDDLPIQSVVKLYQTGKMRLLVFSTILTGVLSWRPREVHIKAGEMVALQCPYYRGLSQSRDELIWTNHTGQELDLSSNMSSAEQSQMGVLIHGRSLVILSVSVDHQGNYSCSFGTPSRQTWFSLRVYTTQSREYEERTTYSTTCYSQESCMLYCPDVNIPDNDTPNITSNGIIWYKKGESSPKQNFFPSVEEDDHGVYTCTRSYLCHDKVYNVTFSVILDVQPGIISGKAEILSPHNDDVIYVALDTTVVIECKAVVYSDFDDVFWLSGTSFVESNNSLPVFYNYTREQNAEGTKMTASLVFRKVSKEDLSKSYTCKLESVDQPASFVTITLAKKDGRSHDAFLMYYKSETDTGLTVENKEWLESNLKEKGYSLCPQNRNARPGKDAAESVLDCIAQSRTVVLIPTTTVPGIGSDLLKEIHASLVKQQTRLVFIKTESGSVPEALQPLSEAGHSVIWRDKHSSFWKELSCYLAAPQHMTREGLL